MFEMRFMQGVYIDQVPVELKSVAKFSVETPIVTDIPTCNVTADVFSSTRQLTVIQFRYGYNRRIRARIQSRWQSVTNPTSFNYVFLFYLTKEWFLGGSIATNG